MPPRLTKVIRLDSMPLFKASFTPEGYLKDKPILTSIGIFEYSNPDGSTRRELRLPEDVFDEDSLRSYRGKPIILTHDAGLVNKDNVAENQVGTILSNGMRDGDDVKADIIIHDTDAWKDSGLKELSLGYNLDLDETPGVWNGQHYDAIQRNIRINHLALVREARAGEQARLNVDSRDADTLIGGKCMSKVTPRKTHRNDGILSPDELAKAIEEYKARRKMADKTDADDEEIVEEVEEKKVPEIEEDEEDMPEDLEERAAFLKEKKDHRDEEPEPETDEELKNMLARQDEDMDILFDIIDTLLAEKAYDEAEPEAEKEEQDPDDIIKDADEDDDWMKEDEDDEEIEEELPEDEEEDSDDEGDYDELLTKKDADEEEEEIPEEEEEENLDDDDEDVPFRKKEEEINMDSIDKVVRQRIRLGMIGKSLNMDGLENMSIRRAKKAIIKAVRPKVRLDGKSEAYINAMFECAVADVKEKTRKDTKYQKRQMFNKDSASRRIDKNSAEAARQRMIKRHSK